MPGWHIRLRLNPIDDRKANGTAIKLPGENATDEEWGKFYDRLGRPASSNDYGLSKDKGIVILDTGLNDEVYRKYYQRN